MILKKLGMGLLVAAAFPLMGLADSPLLPSFDVLDEDGNGEISQAEILGYLASAFDARDLDRDGGLNASEIAVGGIPQDIAEYHVRIRDTNGDGVLDMRELTFDIPILFGAADSNGSGGIDAAEYAEALRMLESMR